MHSPNKRRNLWRWVSVLLAVVAVGLVVWALALKSDRDDAQQQLASTEQQLDETQQDLAQQQQEPTPTATPEEDEDRGGDALVAAGGLAAAKSVYDDLKAELGATQEDLADTEKELQDASAEAAAAWSRTRWSIPS